MGEPVLTRVWSRFLKNEAYDPTSIDDDAIEEYVSKYSQPGGVRSMCEICKSPLPFCLTVSLKHESNLTHHFHTDRATEANVRANTESSQTKLKLPVLAIGSEAFIGKEVHRQMNQVAENVTYKELKFGHQLAEECPEDLAKLYLAFLEA